MNLVRFQRPINSFNVNDLFQGVLNETARSVSSPVSNFVPAVNIKETDELFQLELMVPGYKKEHFSVKNIDGVLTIKATVQAEKEDEKVDFNRREFRLNTFERNFKMPDYIDTESISARYVNGILLVDLRKKKVQNEEKQIEIEIQ